MPWLIICSGLNGPLEDISVQQLEQQFQTNVLGLAAVIQTVLPVMRHQQDGTIINISSIGGRLATPYASAYHATKFAVEGLSESLRFELKRHGIRVKIVEPGGIKTDFIGGLQWANHSAYEPEASHMKQMATRLNDNLPALEGVAEVIYQAAIDRTERLRYAALPGPYLLMHPHLAVVVGNGAQHAHRQSASNIASSSRRLATQTADFHRWLGSCWRHRHQHEPDCII